MRKTFGLLAVVALSIFLSCGNDNNDCESHCDNELAKVDTLAVDSTVHTFKVRNIGRLSSVFNDKNNIQLEAAIANGIEPISDLKSAYNIRIPIQKVVSCEEFYLDSLTHSLPYLRPKALSLLKKIGKSFSDSVELRCGNKYKLKVTSVLRTEASIAKLRRRNRNATDSSAHQYGTTFDISYVKFIAANPRYIVSQECLKNTLGEVLFDLRNNGECYVKYEIKQGCFHITAR
ncbi:MAG: DUF5715 family protein [Muribaculaceae bacterium]|nr:DUF5715 family protein [Muribaculaceae bacterium]